MRIKFCNPITPDLKLVNSYLKESFTSGYLSNFGPAYTELCRKFKENVFNLGPDREILLTSSGHTALMAAYAALGVKRLLVPSFTFEATRAAATLQGIGTIIKDVDPMSGCFTVDIIKSVDPSTYDAIVVVCALSTIPDLDSIQRYCRSMGKRMIIDAAPAFGTKNIYYYGDAFCLSFHATKTLPAGEGGAVILKSDYYDKARSFINFGFDDKKNVSMVGMNAKISEYSCAVLLALIEKVRFVVDKRLENLQVYRSFIDHLIPPTWVYNTVYQSLPIFLDSSEKVGPIRKRLSEVGVDTLQYYSPLDPGSPVSASLYSRNINIPIHQGVSIEDIGFICSVILDGGLE